MCPGREGWRFPWSAHPSNVKVRGALGAHHQTPGCEEDRALTTQGRNTMLRRSVTAKQSQGYGERFSTPTGRRRPRRGRSPAGAAAFEKAVSPEPLSLAALEPQKQEPAIVALFANLNGGNTAMKNE